MFDAKPLVLGTEIYTPKERPLDLHALIPTDRWVPTERVVPTQAFEIDIADNAAMRNEVMTLQHIDFNQIDVNKQMWGLNGSTTLLGTACKYGNQEVFEYLLTRPGIDINRPSLGGYPPFFLCAKSLDLAKKLIERPDFDIHSVADNGDTLFHALATFDPDKAVEFAKILKDKGLDVNQKNKWGEHPLLAACAQGNQTLVEFYLDNGVSLSDLTDRDFSPLMSAVVGGNEQLVQKFLDLGLDPTYQSNNHENLLHIAGKYGHQSPLIKLLALPGLDCNQPNSAGKTPLMAACDARHPELIPLLLPKTNLSKNDIKENSSLCLHITQCEKPVQINFLKKALQCYIDDRRLGANYFNSWGFGFSKQQKIDAAQALLNKINGQDIDLQPHLRALRDGRLSFFNRLYQGIPAAEHRLFKDALAQPRAEKDTPEDRPRPSA
jgi:ankyrin repeat protein